VEAGEVLRRRGAENRADERRHVDVRKDLLDVHADRGQSGHGDGHALTRVADGDVQPGARQRRPAVRRAAVRAVAPHGHLAGPDPGLAGGGQPEDDRAEDRADAVFRTPEDVGTPTLGVLEEAVERGSIRP
jgi:hypothetical protein